MESLYWVQPRDTYILAGIFGLLLALLIVGLINPKNITTKVLLWMVGGSQ